MLPASDRARGPRLRSWLLCALLASHPSCPLSLRSQHRHDLGLRDVRSLTLLPAPCLRAQWAHTSSAVLISEMAPGSSGVCDGFGRMTFLDFSGTWVGIQLIIRPRAKALQSIANAKESLEHKATAGEVQTSG